jgi:hypothetical protein
MTGGWLLHAARVHARRVRQGVRRRGRGAAAATSAAAAFAGQGCQPCPSKLPTGGYDAVAPAAGSAPCPRAQHGGPKACPPLRPPLVVAAPSAASRPVSYCKLNARTIQLAHIRAAHQQSPDDDSRWRCQAECALLEVSCSSAAWPPPFAVAAAVRAYMRLQPRCRYAVDSWACSGCDDRLHTRLLLIHGQIDRLADQSNLPCTFRYIGNRVELPSPLCPKLIRSIDRPH